VPDASLADVTGSARNSTRKLDLPIRLEDNRAIRLDDRGQPAEGLRESSSRSATEVKNSCPTGRNSR
jgi:hypothetical protein